MQKAGSCQFSTPMRRTGRNRDAFLDKPLRKEKLRRLSSVGILDETDEVSWSMVTNSTSKRAKLPKKSDISHSEMFKYASTSRTLQSALVKRLHESRKIYALTSPDSRKDTDELEWQLKDCTKRHKIDVDEHKDSKLCLITKDEEEAAQALFALAQAFTDTSLNKTLEVKPPNEAEDADVKNLSQKRCLVHVYICRFIKTNENKGGHVNAISDTNNIFSH